MFSQTQPSPDARMHGHRHVLGSLEGLASSKCSGLQPGNPALAQLQEAATSRGRSGWAHSTHVKAALGGPGVQPAACSAAQLRGPGPAHLLCMGATGPWESLGRIRAEAGQETQGTGALPSLDTGQGSKHSLFATRKKSGRLDSAVTLRIYFYFSKSCLCLIHVESHKAFCLF